MPLEQVRSISDKENYATYLGLPLLGLNRRSYGPDSFRNSYFTNNGKLLVIIDPDSYGNSYWHHEQYLTDFEVGEGLAILYSCPKQFEPDMAKLINSEYSKLSDPAKQLIYQHSTLHVDFRLKNKEVFSSSLILSIRHEGDDERELPIREQDIMNNVDADVTFEKGS